MPQFSYILKKYDYHIVSICYWCITNHFPNSVFSNNKQLWAHSFAQAQLFGAWLIHVLTISWGLAGGWFADLVWAVSQVWASAAMAHLCPISHSSSNKNLGVFSWWLGGNVPDLLKVKDQNWQNITSAAFYWPKQVTSPAQIQEGRETVGPTGWEELQRDLARGMNIGKGR